MINYREIDNIGFANIFRVYLSGTSSSGKTTWAHKLLKSGLLKFENLLYCYPDIHEAEPVNWRETLTEKICFFPGIPDLEYLKALPKRTCIVFDDLFSQCCESKNVDFLFRVLSSKHELHVIIMTQRYFADSKLGLSIRNCCNYHVLLNNADARTNMRVANYMQLKPEITVATRENSNKAYPYIFIDVTPSARLSGIRVYLDIFSEYKIIVIGQMKFYLLKESDFKASYKIVGENFAVARSEKNESRSKHERKRIKREVGEALQRHKLRSKLEHKNF